MADVDACTVVARGPNPRVASHWLRAWLARAPVVEIGCLYRIAGRYGMFLSISHAKASRCRRRRCTGPRPGTPAGMSSYTVHSSLS